MSDYIKPETMCILVEETLQEWLQGYITLADNNTNDGKRDCRIRRVGDKSYQITDPGGYVDYGTFEINVTVKEIPSVD